LRPKGRAKASPLQELRVDTSAARGTDGAPEGGIAMMRLLFVAALVAAIGGCSKTEGPASAEKSAGPAKMEGDLDGAKKVFAERCATCHGTAGAGDGPAAASLNPKPRAFGDKAWQKTITDDHIEKIIKDGGAAVGKSPLMPPNPDLLDKPEVVKGLRSLVRSYAN
jgi:mono/diheme cytochrome c family protein